MHKRGVVWFTFWRTMGPILSFVHVLVPTYGTAYVAAQCM